MHPTTTRYEPVAPGAAGSRSPIRPRMPCRCSARHGGDAEGGPAYAGGRLLRRESEGAVEADDLAVEIVVLADVLDEGGVLGGPAHPPGVRDLRAPVGFQLVTGLAVGWGQDRAGGYRDHADADRGQIAGGDESHAHHPALGGRVGELADLALVGCDRRGADDDAAVAVYRLLPGDGRGSQPHHVEDAGQVELDGRTEAREVHGLAVPADDPPAGRRAAVGVHRDPQRSHRLRLGHRRPDVALVGGVGPCVTYAQLLLQCLALLVGEVGADHLRSLPVQAAARGLAEAARPPYHDRRAAVDLHKCLPELQVMISSSENSILTTITLLSRSRPLP